jgi:hypothetical protein
MLGIIDSKNKVPIRLTEERWIHIVTAHPEINSPDYSKVLNIIKKPDVILKGDLGELLAVKKQAGKAIWFVVVYKEVKRDDGFVLTAYITTDDKWLFKRKVIWNKI